MTTADRDIAAITPAYRWLVAISGLSGTLAVILSATMIDVAIPSIMGALNYLGKVIRAQALTFGFQDAFPVISFIFMCALLPALLLRRAGAKKPAGRSPKSKATSTG